MASELSPREFLDRRTKGEDMTLLDVREEGLFGGLVNRSVCARLMRPTGISGFSDVRFYGLVIRHTDDG